MRWMFTGILVLFVVALVPVTGAEEVESLVVEAPVQSLDMELTPEPVELQLSPWSCDTTADGSPGNYYCTGTLCPNGQECAKCCSSYETNCGPIECVDMCFE